MREFINWYDEVSVEQFANAQGLIISTTRYDSEMVMTDQEKTALARILAYEGIHGESGHYFHAVDFLWMAHRISTASKLALDNLMDKHLPDLLNFNTKGDKHE